MRGLGWCWGFRCAMIAGWFLNRGAMMRGDEVSSQTILDSITEGVYATDRSRRIIYWNRAAERITGWRAEDIVGKACFDDVLCHVDKDGHQLCGKEHCPLHRAMVTGATSSVPIIVF